MFHLLSLLLLLTGYACSTSQAATTRHPIVTREAMSTNLDWIYRVAWSPDNTVFAVLGSTGSSDQTIYSVHIYDAMSRKVLHMLPIKKPGSIAGDIAFSPDGNYLAAGIGGLTLWDTRTWRTIREIKGPYERGFVTDGLKSLAISPDSKSISVLYQALTWPETIAVRTREDAETRHRAENEIKQAGIGKSWRQARSVTSVIRS